jgi:glutamate transport system substrate-binding protein
MRKRLLLAVLAAATVLAACGDDSSDSGGTTDTTSAASTTPSTFPAGSTMDALQKKGKIVIGTKFDQPLFGLKALSGQPEGFDVEIANLVATAIFGSNLSGKTEFVETPSAIREQSIIDGKVDIVAATYTINDTRKQKVGFAGPYYVAGQSILVKKDNSAITGLSSLAGKKVCTVTGSTPLKTLQERAPTADLSILFDTYSKCIEALKDNRIEAVSTDNVILLGFIKDNPGAFKLVGDTFTQEPYGIGVKREDTVFRNFVNDVLEKAYKDGTWAKAFETQVGKATEIPTPTPPPVNRY